MTDPGPVYFDHAASTPLDPRVAEFMSDCLHDSTLQANPSSAHGPGRAAGRLVDAARAQVARLIGAPPESIVFTSGATESINLAIQGAARAAAAGKRHIVTSRIEHRAALLACRELEREGFEVSWLQPTRDGRVESGQLSDAIRPDTVLVSLMHVNNETGVQNDIEAMAAICHERRVTFHVDAAQSAGKLAIDASAPGIALLSFCAHKLAGPKGVGALYVRRQPRPALRPLFSGGGHEGGLRSGTLATHQIAGFGLACELAEASLATEAVRIRGLRERLWQALQAAAPLWRNGAAEPSVPGILSVGFAGIEGESLLLELDGRLAATSGAACHSATAEPSYVLRALGLSDLGIQASLRLSLGHATTAADVDRAATILVDAVRRLRSALPRGALERIA